ncbi:MAG: hypothetical protein NVS3B14_17370 [Ktedonobacteraceae bacterium]
MTEFTISGGLFVAPIFLLVEVTAAISRQSGRASLAQKAVEDLKNGEAMQFVALDAVGVQTAINAASDLQLRAGDATYVAVAYRLHLPLVSWDKEQLYRASSLITTYSPENYPF